VNPGGGSGRDEPPLDIQIPDDARELDRDVLAYRREQRVQRRRTRLRKLTAPFGGSGTVMPLLASILAVCLVAGAMLSVATFGPTTAPATHQTATATASHPSAPRSSPPSHATSSPSPGGRPSATPSGHSAAPSPSGARPAGSASSPARSSSPSPAGASHTTQIGTP
jgi:hypothetical protein